MYNTIYPLINARDIEPIINQITSLLLNKNNPITIETEVITETF